MRKVFASSLVFGTLIFASNFAAAKRTTSFPLSSLFSCNMEGGPGDWNWSKPEYTRFVSHSPLGNAAGDTVIDWHSGPRNGEIMVILQRADGNRALLVCGL